MKKKIKAWALRRTDEDERFYKNQFDEIPIWRTKRAVKIEREKLFFPLKWKIVRVEIREL